MKKWQTVLMTLICTLLFSSMVSATPDHMYVNRDSINVYKNRDTDSKVIKTFKGGDKLMIDAEKGSWYGVVIGMQNGQMLGWVRAKLLTPEMPQKYCGHKWSEWWTEEEPTCTSSGKAYRSCRVCGKTESKTLKKTGHRYGDWISIVTATCTNEGTKMRQCRVCGHEQWKTVKQRTHRYRDWIVTRAATCTHEGEKFRRCSVCGYEQFRSIDKAAHSYRPWQVTKNATCTSEGSRKRVCSVCGFEQTQTIERKPHSYQWKILIAATDHSSGQRMQVCRVCGQNGTTQWFDPSGTVRRGDANGNVAKLQQLLIENGYLRDGGADGIFGGGTEAALIQFQLDRGLSPDGVGWPQTMKRLHHVYGEWKFAKKVTRDSDGIRERICTECGYRQSETVAAEPSIYRGDRGEKVRKIQKILNALGADAGTEDGIYGQKLDNAYGGIAEEERRVFWPGRLFPSDIDLLFDKWLRAAGNDEWMATRGTARPVITALTVKVVKAQKNTFTYEYTVTNLGENECTLDAILLNFSKYPTFRKDNLVLDIRDSVLLPKHENTVSGTFVIRRSMVEGPVNICALSEENGTGKKCLSNIVVREDFTEEEESDAADETSGFSQGQ